MEGKGEAGESFEVALAINKERERGESREGVHVVHVFSVCPPADPSPFRYSALVMQLFYCACAVGTPTNTWDRRLIRGVAWCRKFQNGVL